ncbi:hypothetical protein BKA65DRAFT_76554 [Rhexocercosporidium sp. MPI-PUGE-AT-0058]|nr:hypothetical protein BKA65DRAFT_76554 [Rhexocercosporidium sp. MPI-PUGE-AT-0058]
MSTMISPNLPTIPRELLLQIIHPSQFPTAKSLLPILQTNKHLYTTLIPHLYRKITIHSHSPRQRYPLPLSRLSRTLIIYPERRSWVREVHILFNSNLDPQRGARWVENAVDLVLTLCELKSLRIESLKRCDWPGTCEGFLDNCWKLGSLRDFVIMNVRLVPAQLRTLQRIPQLESLYISGLDLPPYGEGDDDVNGINPRRSMLISSLDKLEIELSVFDLRSTNGGIFDPFQNLTRLILMSEGYLFKETTQPAESLARILRPLREKLVYLHLSIWRVWNKERMQISFTDFSVLKELKIHDYLAFGPTIQKYIWQLPKIYARSDLAARLPSSRRINGDLRAPCQSYAAYQTTGRI